MSKTLSYHESPQSSPISAWFGTSQDPIQEYYKHIVQDRAQHLTTPQKLKQRRGSGTFMNPSHEKLLPFENPTYASMRFGALLLRGGTPLVRWSSTRSESLQGESKLGPSFMPTNRF